MIRFESVSKVFPNGNIALKEVSLTIKRGEFLFLTGPSGSGKTTFTRLIYRALRPNRGRILLNGVDITRLNRSDIQLLRRNIGVVFQDFKLIPSKTVYDNLMFVLEAIAFPPKQRKERIMYVLEEVNLLRKIKCFPEELSGGEKQRVSIARAIINKPMIILADEPTGNLDNDLGRRILTLFDKINRQDKTTIIFASHNRFLIDYLPRRIVYLKEGAVDVA